MNRTTKAKYDMATRMLKGRIDAEEVAMMSGLPLEEVEKLKEEVVPKNTDAEVLSRLDNPNLDIGQILYDDDAADDLAVENYPGSDTLNNKE
ncbi:MAG: hypothetical protein ACI4L2_05015 [Wujia sp.]